MIEAAVPALRPLLPRFAWTAAASASLFVAAVAAGAPLWFAGALALVPWLPVLGGLAATTWRSAGAPLSFYLIVAATQTGHVLEHVVQIAQLRVLHVPGSHAHGIFGQLDIEWVHFAWNSWILIAVVALLIGRPASRWLWLALPLAAWHLLEHVVLIRTFLATGLEGSPGLLAMGGLIGNGLPIARPELHLIYNLVETVPLLIGLAVAWRSIALGQRR